MVSCSQNHRTYDDCSYMKLCSTGQVHNLVRLMEVEERYGLRGADCINYRRALDAAATAGGVDRAVGGIPPSNTDWRYRIARWMLRVRAKKIDFIWNHVELLRNLYLYRPQAADDFSISRSTAIIALSYCDRFLLSGREISRHLFQIVSVTCLFVASKIFETSPIKLVSL